MSNDNTYERVPDAVAPKRRAPALVRVLGSLVGWGMFFGLALGGLLFWAWGSYTAEGPLKETKVVTFPEGASRSAIAQTLEDQGVISDARVMNAASIIGSFRKMSLKPGEYEFSAGIPMAGVLNALASGKVLTYKVTIPEGWTSQMALARINANDVLAGDPVNTVPEGAVIADTQVFRRGMTRAKLVADMTAAQTKLVDEVWAKRRADSLIKTKEELVTLASIVEKETGKAEERPRVAAVFLNRLQKGMRLQSDPTIIYGIVGGAGKLDRSLLRSDIDEKTAYNTYQIDGLPPGPIAVPGRAALEAVVAPATSEDLYFVADGTGGHAFAATLEAHNDNVKKWREVERNGIQLPSSNEPEPVATNDVVQTPLPSVPETPTAETSTDTIVSEAESTAENVQSVPEPAEGSGGNQPVVAAPKAAEPPPLPTEKKPKPQTAKIVETKVALKPGSVVKVGEKLVPIPRLKKAKP